MRLSKEQRFELEKRVLGDLLCLVNGEDVLMATDRGAVLLDGKPITDNELRSLKSEVQALKTMRIWRIFQETLKSHAERTMFIDSEDYEAMRSGKMLLYALRTMNTMIEVVEQGKFRPKPSMPKPSVIQSS